MELTILMPCLNEERTLGWCIEAACEYLRTAGIHGEVLVADNGSTDGSVRIAERLGARVVVVPKSGYGSALLGGIAAARGRFVIMGDADRSYDFSRLQPFVDALRAGANLVMGDRFAGGIAPGAMPVLHRYVGNPLLSALGRLLFGTPVHDFHCGLRGFDAATIRNLGLTATGMEFASEMVVKASLARLSITEVPTTLARDGRDRRPHLRSWRDGWRHLRFLLIFSPRWLFLIPGLLACIVGGSLTLILLIGPIRFGSVGLDVGTMLYAAALAIVGFQAVLFSILTKLYAGREGFLPRSHGDRLVERLSVERGIGIGVLIFLIGSTAAFLQFLRWGDEGFGALEASETVRIAIPAALGVILGSQTVLSSMFIGILTIPTTATAADG